MAIDPKKHAMPTQEAKVRARNFQEVALGYSEEIAVAEAQRCLNCKNQPCVTGCPVNIRIPEFISKIKAGDFEGAYQTISVTSSLPAVCGRVCPQEKQCESKCTLGIKFEPVGIGRLVRFAADWHNEHSLPPPRPKTDVKSPSWVPVLRDLPARATSPKRAIRSRCSRRSTPRAACSSTEFPNSVCLNPSSQRKSKP